MTLSPLHVFIIRAITILVALLFLFYMLVL